MSKNETNIWQRRRVVWPAVALVILATALAVAAMRSGASRVLVYNETGASIAELGITACGQSQLFRNVADASSVRFKLAPTGRESDLAVVTNGTVMWHGEYLEPRGGYLAVVRLRRDGQVECRISVSWWQRSILGRGEAN